MKKKKRFSFKKLALILAALILIGIVGGYFVITHMMNKSMPQVEGEIHIPVAETVTVTTDDHGVPHIEAESLQDLYTSQGYVQAQSRMLQMELSRRQASGTLSEIVGEATVDTDKYFRTLGLRRAAEASYDLYSDEAKEVLQWFADGVNAYIDEAIEEKKLPIEFTLLGAEPAEWTPIDSLTIGKYMAYDLGGHYETQAFNYYALDQFPEEKALELFPVYPENRKTIIEDSEIDIASQLGHILVPERFNGSNDWVVSGEMTKSGKPLLADDPHLGLATPSIWYQMHLEAEDMNVEGVIFAGVPGIILGHNEHIAWGVTNTGPDVQQLYMEKENPDKVDEFLFEDEWEKAERISEPIKVKDEETIDYDVVETRHGPIVSEFSGERGESEILSLAWTALEPTTELQAILEINAAQDWETFEKGLESFLAPAQNFVFAGDDGTIAYKANGKIPIYEDSEDALLPLPGWEAKYEWDDYIPFDELPRVVNPDKGFIATANNKVVGDDYPYHISNVWAQPYRYERIFEMLEGKDGLTVEDMQAIQMDATNLRAREFVPVILDILQDQDLILSDAKDVLDALTDWDYVDDKEAAGPLIFDHWFKHFETIIYKDIPNEMDKFFGAKGNVTDEILRKGNDSAWIKDSGGLDEVVSDAFLAATLELREDYGNDVAKWEWGDYHQIQFKHPLSSANKYLGYIFNKKKPLAVDGSAYTPMAARAGEDGIVNHGASWRFAIDLDDLTTGYHIVSPGQSGHLNSPWYNDQTEAWVEGDYHATSLVAPQGKILKLLPK